MKQIFFILILSIQAAALLSGQDRIVLAVGDWEPFTSSSEGEGHIAETIVAEAFAMEGIAVDFEYYPWRRSYAYALSTEKDGTFPWASTEERESLFFMSSEPLFMDEIVFFHLKSTDFRWNSADDLREYRIGGVSGFFNTEYLNDQGLDVVEVSNEDLMYKMALAGRIDIFPSSRIVGYHRLKLLFGFSESRLFTDHEKPLFSQSYYLLISKKHPEGRYLMDKFDSGFLKLRESGRYGEITEKTE